MQATIGTRGADTAAFLRSCVPPLRPGPGPRPGVRARGVVRRAVRPLLVGLLLALGPVGAPQAEPQGAPDSDASAVSRAPAEPDAARPPSGAADRGAALPADGSREPLRIPGAGASRSGGASAGQGPRGFPRGSSGPGLDALLQLPSGYQAQPPPPVAGATEAEWRRRFAKAQGELAEAREELERAKRELDAVAEGGASSQWAVAPPGASNSGGGSTSPLSFKLRQELRRSRSRVEAAEKAVRELTIEADLAGVPERWRGAPP